VGAFKKISGENVEQENRAPVVEGNVFVCPFCGLRFIKELKATQHISKDHPKKRKPRKKARKKAKVKSKQKTREPREYDYGDKTVIYRERPLYQSHGIAKKYK